jgi:hypothetical protein
VSEVLLVLMAPRGLEDALHDWLLDTGVAAFTEQGVLEHGTEHSFENALDAVRGSRPRVMFQIAADSATAERLLAAARERWPRAGLRYWTVPLLERGTIG